MGLRWRVGDGRLAIVTTIADSEGGARIRVSDRAGAEHATGPVDAPGWRHQLCAAGFAPDGDPELTTVRKSHVERTLECYRLDGDGRSVWSRRATG